MLVRRAALDPPDNNLRGDLLTLEGTTMPPPGPDPATRRGLRAVPSKVLADETFEPPLGVGGTNEVLLDALAERCGPI